jgi:5-methylcytosine-specific restriction endonuclease McrA
MARRNLRLSKGGAARGSRPSRRSSVRARSSAAAARDGTRNSTRPRAGVRLVHVAMKRAMRKVALRDCGQRCVYCAVPLDQHTATLDHVVPLARGGAHDPGNLVVACAPCNRLKGDLLPFEFFARHTWAGANFVRYARSVHRALKRGARRAVSLAFAA